MTRSWPDRLARWWIDDLPRMTGGLRVVFLGGLFVVALRQFSPLAVAGAYRDFPADLLLPVDVLGAVGLGNPSTELLASLHAICLVSWVCAIAGLLTAPALAVTGLSAFVLNGIGRGIIDGHGWLVPVYSLLFLAFSRCGDTYSVDALIRRRWPSWPGAARPGSIRASGLPRKLVALICVHTLFAGGVSKLMGGWQWADGETLGFYVHATPLIYDQPPRFATVAALLDAHPWLFSWMAAATLALELASPIALFSSRWRHGVFAVALVFHVGIYAVMLPSFAAQAWCYVLLVDWAALWAWARSRPLLPRRSFAYSRGGALAAAGATALAALLLGAIVTGDDRWPLTSVPMYASRVTADEVGGVPMSAYTTRAGLTALGRLDGLPWASKWVFWPRIDVVLTGTAGDVSLMDVTAARRYTWVTVMNRLVQQELRRSATGRYDGPHLDAARVLSVIVAEAPQARVDATHHDAVDLRYRADDGQVVLFTSRLRPPLRPPDRVPPSRPR